jgi:hypothetical protein
MSWKPEVIADSSGKWSGNALRFATKEEAEAYVSDPFMRWTAVRETRVVEVPDEPVTYVMRNGRLIDAAKIIDGEGALDPPPEVTQLKLKLGLLLCTYPACKCIVSTSTTQPKPVCPKGLAQL